MTRNWTISLALALATAVVVASGAAAQEQKPVVKSESVTVHATITAIDSSARLITLKGEDGNSDTVYAGPDIKRFAELKVGQKVTFSYYESMVFAIEKADGSTRPTDTKKVERSTGATPGGLVSQHVTTTVTVNEVNAKVPSITVTTEDGRRVSFKVDDARNLDGVKAGDKVRVTYTQALAISVQ